MTESWQHRNLLERIITYIHEEWGPHDDIAIFSDRADVDSERPPMIGGFIPDVYACNVPKTMEVIGEAKTERDLETSHSFQQIQAFLEYVGLHPSRVFLLSVHWRAKGSAHGIVRRSGYADLAQSGQVHILDGVMTQRQN